MRELLALLAEHNIGAVDGQRRRRAVDGIVSERDVVRHLHSDDAVLDDAVERDHDQRRANLRAGHVGRRLRVMMTERRIRHVPVVTDGR